MPSDLDLFASSRRDTGGLADPATLRQASHRQSRRRSAAVAGSFLAGVLAVAVGVTLAVRPGDAASPVTSSPSAAAGSSGPASPSPSAAVSADPSLSALTAAPCAPTALVLTGVGGDGFAGHALRGFALRNTGTSACTLSGYVTPRFVDVKGESLTTTPVYDGTAVTVTVQPGQSAYFGITTGNVPAADETGAPCDPPAAALRFHLGHDEHYLVQSGRWRACGHGRVEVSPFQAKPDPNWHS